MIEGKKNILQWFEDTGFGYWALYTRGKLEGRNPVMESSEVDEATNAAAYAELEKTLNLHSRGQFTIVARPKKISTSTGKRMVDFDMSYNETNQPATVAGFNGVPPGYVSIDEVDTRIAGALDKYQRDQERKQLEARVVELEKANKDLEKEAASPLNQIWGHVEPYVDKMLPHIMPGVVAKVAGIPKPDTIIPSNQTTAMNEEVTEIVGLEDMTPEQEKRLEQSIGRFAATYPTEWLDLLEKISFKVKADPNVINYIKPFLT